MTPRRHHRPDAPLRTDRPNPPSPCVSRRVLRTAAAMGCVLLLLAANRLPAGPAAGKKAAAKPAHPAPVEWTTFHMDNQRRGVSPLNLTSPPFRLLWTFSLGSHTWKYCEGASVWSACALIAEVKGKMCVFVGTYDHNVYCLNADTGKEIWRYTTGCLVKAAPTFARINGRPMLFVASSDRTFYGLDAATGQEVWNLETYPWSYTVGESIAGSPLVAKVNGKPVLFDTMWNDNRRPLRTSQVGDLFAIEPATGALIWKKRISTAKLSSPTFAVVRQRPEIFVGCEDGTVYCCDACTGKLVWKLTSGDRIDATPVFTHIGGQPIIIITNEFGMVRALSAVNGARIWRYKCGHEILSTPAVVKAGDTLMLIVGASDRCIHAIDAQTGEGKWTFETGKYVVASPAIARIRGRPAIFVNSLDNYLYVLDTQTGCEIMRFAAGNMLWPYETRGISIWSSPSLGTTTEGRQILLYPGHDGKLYALTSTNPGQKPKHGDASLTGWTPGSPRKFSNVDPTFRGPTFWILPLIAGTLILAGLVLTFLPRPPEEPEKKESL